MDKKCPGCGKKHKLTPKRGVLDPHLECDYQRRIAIRDAHQAVCIPLKKKILELEALLEYKEVCVQKGKHELYTDGTKRFCRQCGKIEKINHEE